MALQDHWRGIQASRWCIYGDYVEDLEDDTDDIIRYFGVDFLIKPGKKNIPRY
jgi:hypothetical protein